MSQQLYCEKCGKAVVAGQKYCVFCGNILKDTQVDRETHDFPKADGVHAPATLKPANKPSFFRTIAGRICIIAGIVIIIAALVCGGIVLVKNQIINLPEISLKFWEERPEQGEEDVPVAEISAGDSVTFGTFEQDLNEDNGAESIEWIVLKADSEQVLMLSKKILYVTEADRIYYGAGPNDSLKDPCSNWAESGIRVWLNRDFLKGAFSKSEEKMIVTGMDLNKVGGDKVFFLTNEELDTFFPSEEERCACVTDFAWKQQYDLMQTYVKNPTDLDAGIVAEYSEPFDIFLSTHQTEPFSWWLAAYSGDSESVSCSFVKESGEITKKTGITGKQDNERGIGIRPAIRIKRSAIHENDVIRKELIEEETTTEHKEEEMETTTTEKKKAESPVTMYVTGDELLVRTGPGKQYQALWKLYIGDTVKVYDVTSDGWAHIKYNGQDVFVYSGYLSTTPVQRQTTPATPPPAPSPTPQTPQDSNYFYNPANNVYDPNLVTIKPALVYYDGNTLYAICYVLNGFSQSVYNISVNQLEFYDSAGNQIAGASFGNLQDLSIAPYSSILWEFTFPADCVASWNADLASLTYHSNVDYRY